MHTFQCASQYFSSIKRRLDYNKMNRVFMKVLSVFCLAVQYIKYASSFQIRSSLSDLIVDSRSCFSSVHSLQSRIKNGRRGSSLLSSISDESNIPARDASFWTPGDEQDRINTKNLAELYGFSDRIQDSFVVQVQYPVIVNSVNPELWDSPKIQQAILADLFLEKPATKTAKLQTTIPKTRNLALDNWKDSLVNLRFLGVGEINVPILSGNNNITMQSRPCLFLAKEEKGIKEALPIPMTSERYRQFLPLLIATQNNLPISKTRCLSLNSILINRDKGLFDSIPWAEWTVLSNDQSRDFDATGKNRIAKLFRKGKRDAFERFMGKDWPGRSWSLGNLAQKALYELNTSKPINPQVTKYSNREESNNPNEDIFNSSALLKRVLDLELREAQSELAEAEQILAIHIREHGINVEESDFVPASIDFVFQERLQYERSLLVAQKRVTQALQALETNDGVLDLSNRHASRDENGLDRNQSRKGVIGLLQTIVSRSLTTVDGRNNTAPYRGAYGYAPTIDTDEETRGKSVDQIYPYTGPMDLLMELLEKQLRASVVGTVLENTSLEEGVMSLGGAGVIMRRPPHKGSLGVTSLDGQVVDLPVDQSDAEIYNDEVMTGDVRIVECESEECVVWSMAAGRPISIDPILYESLAVPISSVSNSKTGDSEDALSQVVVNEKLLSQKYNFNTSTSSPKLQAPVNNSDKVSQTTSALIGDGEGSSIFASNAIVDTIQNPSDFDAMSINSKARLLMETDSFKGVLPRPRVIRLSGGSSAPIDRLLFPFLDESVRNQLLIREAESRGDQETANILRQRRSRRHIAKDLRDSAKESGSDDLAEMWQEEADFRKSLRADVTQDEGAYSRFLDKDEWYERDRLARVENMKKMKKSKSRFFNLDEN